MGFNETRSRVIERRTCLRHFAGRQSIRSAVFDASTLTADSDGFLTIPIGTFLSVSGSDPTKVKAYQALGTDANEIQTITITGTPTGGTFTLRYVDQVTAPIAYNAASTAVAAALGALRNVGGSNITVAGGALPGAAVTVTFRGLLGNQAQPALVADGSGLTGGTTPAISVVRTTPGTTAEKIVGVYDGPDHDWGGSTGTSDEPIPIYYHGCVFDITQLQNWTLYETAARAALPTCEFW